MLKLVAGALALVAVVVALVMGNNLYFLSYWERETIKRIRAHKGGVVIVVGHGPTESADADCEEHTQGPLDAKVFDDAGDWQEWHMVTYRKPADAIARRDALLGKRAPQ
jgi:hypothetical protein